MAIKGLATELTFAFSDVEDYVTNTANKRPIVKVEVVTSGVPTDVTQAVSQFTFELHKNRASSFTLLIQDSSAASFPEDDEVRIHVGYNISGVDKFQKVYVGNIKRKTNKHISKRNALEVLGFGLSYKLMEQTGTEKHDVLVSIGFIPNVNSMGQLGADIAGEVSFDPPQITRPDGTIIKASPVDGLEHLGAFLVYYEKFTTESVPKRWAGKADDLVRKYLDLAGLGYNLGPLDYDIDVQLNFETALQLIQHVLSLAPNVKDWWADAWVFHARDRDKTGGVDVTLTGTKFSILDREKSTELKSGHTAEFVTPFRPSILISSIVRLSDANIGVDRDVFIDRISISFAHNSQTLMMQCRGEIV